MKELNIGIIGFGLRVGNIFEGLYKNEQGVKVHLAAICDPKDRKELEEDLTRREIPYENTRF